MLLKNNLKKIKNRILYGKSCDSETYVRYLRSIGMTIGEGTIIFDPKTNIIDVTRPWMINMGKNVQITAGVTILTHGYDWSVLKGVYGEVLGSSGKVEIGDNVFVGMHSTILKGVNIGKNVIIGANSLVNKNIPDNCVAAGNPCKVLMSLQDYYEKRKAAQLKEAKELVQVYREIMDQEPDEHVLREFFWLFSDNPAELPEVWKQVNCLGGNEQYTNLVMQKHRTTFKSMEDFLRRI